MADRAMSKQWSCKTLHEGSMRVAMDSANMSVKKEVSEMTKEELLQGYQAWGSIVRHCLRAQCFQEMLGQLQAAEAAAQDGR